MRNVLVTGGAGFIGSALVRGLLDESGVKRVIVVDNLESGKQENLADIAGKIEFHETDVRDYAALEPLFDGVDVVFHLAAIASVPRSIDEPQLCHDVNVNGTFHVLRAAVRGKAKKVVYAASSAAYGNAPGLPKTEDMLPDPRSPYAVQKLIGEFYMRTFQQNFGVETTSLRYFNVFGPRQDPASPYSGVLSIFCTRILERRSPTIFGDGEQSRDFIYVDDIVALNIEAARTPSASGRTYNAGCGRRIRLNEVWDLLQQIEGVELPAEHGPDRPGDVRHSQADISRARQDLGFEPQVDFEEGLRKTLDWFRESAPAAQRPEPEM